MNAPAGFWKRYVAYGLDTLILGIATQLIVTLVAVIMGDDASTQLLALLDSLIRGEATATDLLFALRSLLALLAPALLWSSLLYVLLSASYFVGFESSSWQATPGKRALGLQVTDQNGHRLSPARAGARFVAALASWLSLNLGHALAAWTPERRALHDYLAGTRVNILTPAHARMPVWGWVIVALSLALTVLLLLAMAAMFLFYLWLTGAL